MTPNDYITLIGGLAWAIILIARQAVAYNTVIRSQTTTRKAP